jgi:hypothetical protein
MDNSDPTGDTVLIKTNSGSRMDVDMNGKTLHVMPKGLRVSRRLAIRLLIDYGYRGKYWARERSTGLRKIDVAKLAEETKRRFEWYIPGMDFSNFNPAEDFLIHVPDTNLATELDELSELANMIEQEQARVEAVEEDLVTV